MTIDTIPCPVCQMALEVTADPPLSDGESVTMTIRLTSEALAHLETHRGPNGDGRERHPVAA